MKYIVSVSWGLCNQIEIEAESDQEAIKKAREVPLPSETAEYLDGSFQVDALVRPDGTETLVD